MSAHKNDGIYEDPWSIWDTYIRSKVSTKPVKVAQQKDKILTWERRDDDDGSCLVYTILDSEELLSTTSCRTQKEAVRAYERLIKREFRTLINDLNDVMDM